MGSGVAGLVNPPLGNMWGNGVFFFSGLNKCLFQSNLGHSVVHPQATGSTGNSNQYDRRRVEVKGTRRQSGILVLSNALSTMSSGNQTKTVDISVHSNGLVQLGLKARWVNIRTHNPSG